MIKKIKVKVNLVLGIIIGFFLSQMIIVEGYAIIEVIQKRNSLNILITSDVLSILKILAFIIFIATIGVFNTKKGKRYNFK